MVAGQKLLLTTNTLTGDKVRNREGEDLGAIKDFMIDLDSGCMAYAVLSFGASSASATSSSPCRGRP